MAARVEAEVFDKSTWGEGLWQHEPDRVEFEHAGLPCLMVRNHSGVWCGYAAVLPGHPWHGVEYGATPEGFDKSPDCLINVHGGITFSGACRGNICHVPKPGEPDNVWWFGFDCAHASDYCPALEAKMRGWGIEDLPPHLLGPHYRHMTWVQDEVKALAEQLSQIVRA